MTVARGAAEEGAREVSSAPGGSKGGVSGGAERLCAVSCYNPTGEPLGIEVHVLTETCAMPQPDEAAKLAHFLKVL